MAVTKHGHNKRGRRSPTYVSWMGMHWRCRDSASPRHSSYGARGFAVDKRWSKFENFLSDMGDRPDGTTLDRVDNDKGYSPGNCRWATRTQQNNNTRANVILEHNGESMTLAEWERARGITTKTLRTRYAKGWTTEQILGIPIGGRR